MHDDIKTYFFKLSGEGRRQFAGNCRTTEGHIRNVCYGDRPASPALAALFERFSGGAVSVETTLPGHRWVRIKDRKWPHPQGRPLSDVAATTKEA